MYANEWMFLRFKRLLTGEYLHTSPLLLISLTIGPVGSVTQRSRMNRGQPVYLSPQRIGHLLIRRYLIGKKRLAPHRRNRQSVKRCGSRRHGHKAPVTMKHFGENRGCLVSIALDSGNFGVLINMPKERIFSDGTELLTKPDQLLVRELLIRKRHHLVLQPVPTDCCHQLGGQGLIQSNAGNGRSAAVTRSLNR